MPEMTYPQILVNSQMLPSSTLIFCHKDILPYALPMKENLS